MHTCSVPSPAAPGTLGRPRINKPLMLGRGVKTPMVVILLGALGGMAASGIHEMFVGATLLTLGYQIFMGWVADNPNAKERRHEGDTSSAS